jgi:hypothetical protein
VIFPTSLDKIEKEIPVHKGKNSIFLTDEQLFFKLLEKFNHEVVSLTKPTFGYAFTILVKSKETREKLKKSLSNYNVPIFTVYESKV